MNTLWYSAIVVSLFYISWSAFGQIRPRLREHSDARLHHVNAGVSCCLSLLAFMFILYANGAPLGTALPFTCFLTWAVTLFVILQNLQMSTFTRSVSRGLIIAAPLIFLLYPSGVNGFLSDVDTFAIHVLQRDSPPKTDRQKDVGNKADTSSRADKSSSQENAESRSDTNIQKNPDASSKESTQSDAAKSTQATEATSEKGKHFQVSDLLKAIFFFIQAFLVCNYYGKMWHFRRVEKERQKLEGSFERESIDQAILILSIAVSGWIAFVLLGFDTLSVSVFSGLVALSVSVALKDLLANFLAGVLLLWGKSIKHKDVVALDKNRIGEVQFITLRHMEIRDRNDISYLVPHSQLLNTVIENWTRDDRNVRLKVDVGVAYDSDIDKVKEVMRSVCYDVPRVLKRPPPNALIMSMDESAIHFQLRFRIADPENGIRNVMSEVYEKLVERFRAMEVEIPFPQREIRLLSPTKAKPIKKD